jgi:hypothetical protein
MGQALDGPAKQGIISATTASVTEVKIGASAFDERKVVTIQPLGGTIRVYFADEGIVPSAATVGSDGLQHFKRQKDTYEATCTQTLYIVAESGTFDVVIVERA